MSKKSGPPGEPTAAGEYRITNGHPTASLCNGQGRITPAEQVR